MSFFFAKSNFHFIRKMNLFCGGKFLKKVPYKGSLKGDPWKLIFSFSDSEKLTHSKNQPSWQPVNQTSELDSHPGCHSIRPVNWTAILAVTQSNQ